MMINRNTGALLAAIVMLAGCAAVPTRSVKETAANPPPDCSKTTSECWLSPPDKLTGFSGTARVDATTHFVVHDVDPRNPSADRLGIVQRVSADTYRYQGLKVAASAWQDNDANKQASDLEGACRLDGLNNEFLVVESGRFDTRDKNPHQGRIFHVQLELGGAAPKANITKAIALGADRVTEPAEAFSHSVQEYEGLACVRLPDSQSYLVIIGERGGSSTGTGTVHWGIYDPSQTNPEKSINWVFPTDLTSIRAPGQGAYDDTEWRDITGLHADEKGRLFATASFDHPRDKRPFGGALYQLGVICIDAQTDQHGEAALCGDYHDAPRPQLLPTFDTLYQSTVYKFESVSAPSADNAEGERLSIASEDEDDGGAWWPAVTH